MPTCSKVAPILCPDGTCASLRDNCKSVFDICDSKTPIRCED